MTLKRIAALLPQLLLAFGAASAQAADLFPLRDVRLGPGSPFLDAQTRDFNYLMAMKRTACSRPSCAKPGWPRSSPATATGSRRAWTAIWAAITCPRWH